MKVNQISRFVLITLSFASLIGMAHTPPTDPNAFSDIASKVIGKTLLLNRAVARKADPGVHGRRIGPAVITCKQTISDPMPGGGMPSSFDCWVKGAPTRGNVRGVYRFTRSSSAKLGRALTTNPKVPARRYGHGLLRGPVTVACEEIISDPMPSGEIPEPFYHCRIQ